MEAEGLTIFGVEWRRILQLFCTGVLAIYFLLMYTGACLFVYLLWAHGY